MTDNSPLKTRLTLRPGQRGTKRLMAQYGEQLVCIRYRYDAQRQKRVKTVELIIEEADLVPHTAPYSSETLVDIRLDITERGLQQKVKAAGGKWRPAKQVWELPYAQVIALALQDRICGSSS